MKVTVFKTKLCAAAVAAAMLLSSCAMQGTPHSSVTTNQAFAPLSGTLEQYQAQVAGADSDSVFPASLLLARAYIVSGKYAEATSLLQNLRQHAITPLELDEISIIEALSCYQQGQMLQAQQLLAKVNTMTLPPQAASYYYQLHSNTTLKLYQSGGDKRYLRQAFASKRALISTLGAQDQRIALRQSIDILKELTPSELSAVSTRVNEDPELAGYFEFALIDSSANQSLKDKLFASWQEKYPSHPLNQLLTTASAAAPDSASGAAANPLGKQYAQLQEGDKIAVLLPLSGRFAASVGEPARLGIIAALKDRNMRLNAVFYDTNRLGMEQIVSRLQADGTAYIIGPVLKPEVEALLNAKPGIPAILLNTPEQPLPDHTWYFNLGPDYEGQTAASKMALDGKRSPLVMYADNQKARRALNGFTSTWQQAAGQAPASCALGNADPAAAAKNCNLNGVDAVYIAATAQQAPLIKSALPAALTTYITDQSYNGVNSSPNEALLIGAQLGDMPWLITDSTLKDEFMRNLQKANPQVQRIFAAAYDSIQFALNVNNLAQNPADVLHGLSGDLQLGADGLIESAPLWITIAFPRVD